MAVHAISISQTLRILTKQLCCKQVFRWHTVQISAGYHIQRVRGVLHGHF